MNVSRKQFLLFAAAALGGCRSVDDGAAPGPPQPARVVDAGPVSGYAADGVYDSFRAQGFFVIRRGKRLFALASLCTHRRCKILPETDLSFSCPCHGSSFDAGGRVTAGPATRDLPVLETFEGAGGRLMVRVPAG
jgi:Rieske Fe-S protein